MATTTLADQAKRNGSGDSAEAETRGRRSAPGGPIGALVGRAAGAIGGRIASRLTADLDDRDPDLIRERLPTLWLIASIWFRAEVRNLGNIPEDRPVLMVGNHSGGNSSPETYIFQLAFSTFFGVERRFHQLAHSLVVASPLGQLLRPFGTVSASHENAEKALDSGAALLVFPGGDWEVHRPFWERYKIDLGGRKGFIRLALNADVPIVPVVTAGGQETALFLGRGERLARLTGVDRLFRYKVMPIVIGPPWGLSIGDLLPRIPLPAKITSEVLPPIELREEFGPDPDLDEVYDEITGRMQDVLDGLAAERRFPVIG
jgi:1-acyl-sn-glycerol-3-phosphate acyltransferase